MWLITNAARNETHMPSIKITWTSAGLLSIGPLGINLSEIRIGILSWGGMLGQVLLTAGRLETLQGGGGGGVETIHFAQLWWKIEVEIRHFPHFC